MMKHLKVPSVTYDPDADATYVTLIAGTIARTVELSFCVSLDLDEHGTVLGVEVLHP